MAAAVARVALEKIASPAVLLNVERQGNDIRAGLAKIDHELHLFSEVRGRGLMIGAVLDAAYKGRAGEILDLAAAHGLLILQAGPDVLRIVPPLTITDEETAEGLERLQAALTVFANEAKVA
jgi:acetylornithine/N-succinyldiaminopimelate aminotransferase